jgi:hypothetical protein
MRLRVVLIALLVVGTAAFVVGVSVERAQGENHAEPATAVEGEREAGMPAEAGHEDGAESGEAARAEESAGAAADEDKAETFLGIDYEAVPFIVLAAAFSLALAAAVWLRPGSVTVLALVVVAMVAFAVLDAREVVHQLDEDNGGLALLAGVVAALHLGVAAVALALARGAATSSRPLA